MLLFSPVSHLFAFAYIHIFYLTCSFLLPCRFSPEWDHLCPRYFGVIFYPSGTICAQNLRFYLEATIIVLGEVILLICCFPSFLICLLLFIYIFIQLVLFCLLVGSFSFLFSDVFQSGMRCGAALPNHLQALVRARPGNSACIESGRHHSHLSS